jgi:hypothetical protein
VSLNYDTVYKRRGPGEGKFEIFLGRLNGFCEKYGFFDEKIGDHPYSFISPFSAIL